LGYKQKYRGQGKWERYTIDLNDFIQVLIQANVLVCVKMVKLTHVNVAQEITQLKELVKYENVTNKK
jgi:hypothetical protein